MSTSPTCNCQRTRGDSDPSMLESNPRAFLRQQFASALPTRSTSIMLFSVTGSRKWQTASSSALSRHGPWLCLVNLTLGGVSGEVIRRRPTKTTSLAYHQRQLWKARFANIVTSGLGDAVTIPTSASNYPPETVPTSVQQLFPRPDGKQLQASSSGQWSKKKQA